MLEVYSQEKSAFPMRGVVASVGLLVVSIALACGVMAGRRQTSDTELGERVALGNWPISVRGPAGWLAGGGGRTTSGFVFVERSSFGQGRQVQFQRAGFRGFLPPSYYARLEMIGAILQLPESRLEGLYRNLGSAPFGPLPGWLVMVGPLAIHFGVAPDGTVYWAMMDSPNPITPAELRILQDVTASIEWRGPPIVEDPSSLWESLPFRFDVPAGARFWRVTDEGSAPLICSNDPGSEGAWHIEFLPTFLAPGREPAELVRDHLAWRSQGKEPAEIEVRGTDSGTYARAEINRSDKSEPLQSVAVRDLGERAAVMLKGIADEAGRGPLRRAEQNILRSLRRTGETEDLSAEVDRGRRLIARVVREAGQQWSEQDREWWYLILDGGKAIGFHHGVRRAGERAGEAGFYVDDAHYYGLSRITSVQARSLVFVPREGDGVTMTVRGRRRTEGMVSNWELSERHANGETALHIEWSDDTGTKVSRTARVDSSFLADPFTDSAYFAVATEADPDEMVMVAASGHPLVHDVYWVKITPMIEGRSGNSVLRQSGLSVSVVFDFDPEPDLWYFDPRGNVKEIRFGGRQSLVAVSERQVYARFPSAGRILAEMDSWWNR
jgi:hypothetical protein